MVQSQVEEIIELTDMHIIKKSIDNKEKLNCECSTLHVVFKEDGGGGIRLRICRA